MVNATPDPIFNTVGDYLTIPPPYLGVIKKEPRCRNNTGAPHNDYSEIVDAFLRLDLFVMNSGRGS